MLDAFQYQNAATNAAKAWRYFNVTTLAGSFETPLAQFQVNIDNVLPVELTLFSSNCDNDYSFISWQTASEHNSASFILERSADGTQWDEITEMDAAGNSNSKIDYQYQDFESYRFVGYYRLIQIDIDGKESIYGPISSLCAVDEMNISLYPNPTENDFDIKIEADQEGSYTVSFEMEDGKILDQFEINLTKGMNFIPMQYEGLNSGIYRITLANNDKKHFKKVSVK